MSDQSGGPGWWQASDGKWYPPEAAAPRLPPPPPAPPAGERTTVTIPVRERTEWASLAGAAALVLGSFLTWASAGPFKIAGTEGDGWLTIGLGLIAGWLSWRKRYPSAALAAALGGGIILWKFVDLADLSDNDFWSVEPGVGLFVCGIGALVCTATSLAYWFEHRA